MGRCVWREPDHEHVSPVAWRSRTTVFHLRRGAEPATLLHTVGQNTTSPLRGLSRRFNALLLGVPVFVKVMGIALGMVVVLGAGMLWQIHQTWHAHLLRDLEQRGQKFADRLAVQCDELTRSGRTAEIPSALQQALTAFPDAVHVILQDQAGNVAVEVRMKDTFPDGSKFHELTATQTDGLQQLRFGFSTTRVDQEVGWLTRRLARTTAVIALIGILAAWWLSRIFSHPIEELATLTHTVKAGDYQVKAAVRARDEVGELAIAFNEMTEALAQKEAARQQLLRKVISAGEEERKRIARELHDQTGQALTSQIAGLSALENQSADEALRRRLIELRQQAEQTLTEVHDLSVTLRPSVLDDVGLVAALQRHCQIFAERLGVAVKCADIGLDGRRLPAEVELTIYRVVQEALTNAVRHGQATNAHVLVQLGPTGALATIQDNGCGFDARDWQKRCLEGNHLGLLGIEERVTLLGGSFCVESGPGKGTRVYADIPLRATA